VGGIFKAVLLIPLLLCLVVVMTFAGASVGVLMLAAFAVLALFIARWFFALLRGV
jgi:ABC-type antimicrobial peptide transport system permease subunit